MNRDKLPNWGIQYLQQLELPIQEPSYSYLEKICTAQLTRFPFENISKLIYYRDQQKNGYLIPSNEVYIDHFVKYQFGGTCFTQNSKLLDLLRILGFHGYLVKLGDDHMAILVELLEFPNERVFVDCGAAAPIFQPVRFEAGRNNVSKFGSDEVIIKTLDADVGQYHYIRYRNGVQNGKDWTFNIFERRECNDFTQIIERSNVSGVSFLSSLRCQIWQLDLGRSLSLKNNQFTIRYIDGSVEKHNLKSITDIETVIATQFRLPRLPVREAIEVLESMNVNIFDTQEK